MLDLVEELHRVRNRQWNSGRFIVFQTVILQQARHITAYQAIRQRIEKRLDAWEAGHHGMLVEENLCTCSQYLIATCREESKDNRDKTNHI